MVIRLASIMFSTTSYQQLASVLWQDTGSVGLDNIVIRSINLGKKHKQRYFRALLIWLVVGGTILKTLKTVLGECYSLAWSKLGGVFK